MTNHYMQLCRFLNKYWSYNSDKITLQKSLDDLGMYADDKRDFLNAFSEKFNVEPKNLNFEKFCEPGTFNPFLFFFKKRNQDSTVPIYIQHLVEVIEKGEWFDPEI